MVRFATVNFVFLLMIVKFLTRQSFIQLTMDFYMRSRKHFSLQVTFLYCNCSAVLCTRPEFLKVLNLESIDLLTVKLQFDGQVRLYSHILHASWSFQACILYNFPKILWKSGYWLNCTCPYFATPTTAALKHRPFALLSPSIWSSCMLEPSSLSIQILFAGLLMLRSLFNFPTISYCISQKKGLKKNKKVLFFN